MIDVSVMWPNIDEAAFDYDYYLQKHLPMIEELLGDKIKRVEVARGVGGLAPGAPPPYVTMLTCTSIPSTPSRPLSALTSRQSL